MAEASDDRPKMKGWPLISKRPQAAENLNADDLEIHNTGEMASPVALVGGPVQS